jgi:hypothetical protein
MYDEPILLQLVHVLLKIIFTLDIQIIKNLNLK